ncbi:MAG TPA: beta-propeller fold lactonase family protein, partial [Terriglobia bacterium]|nr:beta-propeller fold lactonase family protein [Terriglobia bacterium]
MKTLTLLVLLTMTVLASCSHGPEQNPASTSSQETTAGREYLAYVGTYTGPKSKGIYAYRFDASTGKLTPMGLAAETENPSFLAVSPNRQFLYAVNETDNYQGKKTGAVSAFSIDRETGKLTFLNQLASRGTAPCYISLDNSGKYVM